jgi:UDP-glucose 4-epimerase
LFNEVVEALGVRLERPVEVRDRNPDDAYTILLDPGRTHTDFEWTTSTPLHEGVRQAVGYYRDFGITETYTHLRGVDEHE